MKTEESKTEKIYVDIDEKTMIEILRLYVKKNLRPECLETFEEVLLQHGPEIAIRDAIINEGVLQALLDLIEKKNREEFFDDLQKLVQKLDPENDQEIGLIQPDEC